MPRRPTAVRLLAALLVVAGALPACKAFKKVEKAPPQPESRRIDVAQADISPVLRGTIESQARLVGFEPMVVRGYGLVVGLDGNGSRDIPPPLRAHMEREMQKYGVGSHRAGWGQVQPSDLLDSLDTAVVVVEAIIPPGAVEGTEFDVRVFADRASSTRSLEGGTLYTAELRPGSLRTGAGQRFAVASARGPVFVNPFAEPGAIGRDTVNRQAGRVLSGGVVTEDQVMRLVLRNPSHGRARLIEDAINTRFRQEPGQRDKTARGESDESIVVTVPPSFRNRTEEFMELLRHTTIRQSGAERVARDLRRYVQERPADAGTAAWRWYALGPRCLPIIKDLYDYPEELPRLAALTAGAKLDDPLAVPPLIDMTRRGSADTREQAATLLGSVRLNPQVDIALRELLSDESLDVRLAAYESLVDRRDPLIDRVDVGGKYLIDVVASRRPMVYITQRGQPRLVLFGRDLRVRTPLTLRTWSDRLLMKERGPDELEVYYAPGGSSSSTIQQVGTGLREVAAFLGHETTIESPAPGLALSYGEVVGVVHALWRNDYLESPAHGPVDFRAELDRIKAAILDREAEPDVVERPEFGEGEGAVDPFGDLFERRDDGADAPNDDDALEELTLPPPPAPERDAAPAPERPEFGPGA